MKTQKWIVPAIIVIVALVLIGWMVSRSGSSKAPAAATTTVKMATSTASTTASSSVAAMTVTASATSPIAVTTEPASSSDTGYKAFTLERMMQAKSGMNVVLFFYSKTSTSSVAMDSEIRAHASEIPANALVLEVYADESPILSARYGVTSTPFFVLIDANGDARASGATLASLASAK